MWDCTEREIHHIKSRETERSNNKSHVQRRYLGDACRHSMDIVNTGAWGREDSERVDYHSDINYSNLVKLVCKESHNGTTKFWMGE